MSVEWICDGCGARSKGSRSPSGDELKPPHWYCRGDEDGDQHACSRECIGVVAKKSGKTSVVLPI
jgi:hypothetical protein